MRHEIELLLCCTGSRLDAGCAARIQTLLQANIDWDHLLQTARMHDMMPLLYWGLRATDLDAVPQTVSDCLRDHFYANAQHNLFLTQELLRLLELLRQAHIPAVPFKGPILAASLYGNLALRQFCDLDILVRQQDALKARDLIASLGYQQQTEPGYVQDSTWIRSHREFRLARQDGKVAVDLQWHVPSDWRTVRSFPLDEQRLWERLEPFSLAGTAVSSFAPEDLLLTLCVHGASHGWRKLKFACDVAELLRCNPELDLECTLAQASEVGVGRMVLLGLLLVNDLLRVRLPARVLQRIQDDAVVQSLSQQVREWIFDQRDERYLFRRFREAVFSIRLRERLRDRIPYVVYFLDYPRRHFVAWQYARHTSA